MKDFLMWQLIVLTVSTFAIVFLYYLEQSHGQKNKGINTKTRKFTLLGKPKLSDKGYISDRFGR